MKRKVMRNSMIGTDYKENQVGDYIPLTENVRPRFVAFGQKLKTKRLAKCFTLVDAVERSTKYGNHISKSLFSMYENGKVRDIDDRNMATLSKVYDIPYRELVDAFCSQKYDIDMKNEAKNLSEISELHESLEILSLAELKGKQQELPINSIVVVSADDFLDDDVFFLMVKNNIDRGVKYVYHVPSHSMEDINIFREKLVRAKVLGGNKKKVEESTKCFVLSKEQISFNFVVHIYGDEIEAFEGIVSGRRPSAYHQVSSARGLKLLNHINYSIKSSGSSDVEGYSDVVNILKLVNQR